MADTTFVDRSTPIVADWLNDVNDTIYDAAADITGSTARTQHSKNADVVSVKDFGAVGDGVTDDTLAMQAAHATGALVDYPAGTFVFTTLTGITAGGIRGAGKGKTILASTDTSTADLLTFTANYVSGAQGTVFTFQDFTLQVPSAAKSAGAGISITAPTTDNQYALFSGVTFQYTPIGIDFVNASLWKVVNCDFLGYTLAGIQVANAYDTDAGDSLISGNVFNTSTHTGTTTGILQKNSGGLKVLSNKFLGGQYAYLLNYNVNTTLSAPGNSATGVLTFVGNSCELQWVSSIHFAQAATTGATTFKNITISGNEFGVFAGTNPTHISNDTNAAWLSIIAISGNVFNLTGSGTITAIAFANASDINITGNIFRFNGGTTPYAVSLNTCDTVGIGKNTYANITNLPFSLTTCTNVTIYKDTQVGNHTGANVWSAYNALYINTNSESVTFTVPFLGTLTTDDISVTCGGGSGEIGAVVTGVTTSSNTTTGFTYKAISSGNANAANTSWRASGVL